MDHVLIRLNKLQEAASILQEKINSLERRLFAQSKARAIHSNQAIEDTLHQVSHITKELFKTYRKLNAANIIIDCFMKMAYN